MGKTIDVSDFDTVITCKGPNRVVVYINGQEIPGVIGLTFTVDSESFAETNIKRFSTENMKKREDVLVGPNDNNFKVAKGDK